MTGQSLMDANMNITRYGYSIRMVVGVMLVALMTSLSVRVMHADETGPDKTENDQQNSGNAQNNTTATTGENRKPAGHGKDPVLVTDRAARSLLALRSITREISVENPHLPPEIVERRGTAFVVGKGLILTDMELVRNASAIELRSYLFNGMTTAQVKWMAFDAGLAILEADNKDFIGKIPGLELDETYPELSTELKVLGYVPRDQGLLKEVSRVRMVKMSLLDGSDVDHHNLIFSETLSGPEFTGGPAIMKGKVVGLYHHRTGDAEYGENKKYTSYIIPSQVIRHVFDDVGDSKYNGFPDTGFLYSPLVNLAYRDFLSMSDVNKTGYGNLMGVVVDRVPFHSTARTHLFPGDVILSINNEEITSSGRIEGYKVASSLPRYINTLQCGKYPVSYKRQGKVSTKEIEFQSAVHHAWKRRSIDLNRPYYLTAGMIFQGLDWETAHILRLLDDTSVRFRYENYIQDTLDESTEQFVVLTKILRDETNLDYEGFTGGVVKSVDNKQVRNLKDFAEFMRSRQRNYIEIEFYDRPDTLVINTGELDDMDRRIQNKYNPQENGRVR